MSVRSLQHFALAVPDPVAGEAFYRDFGLESKRHSNHVAMRCAGRDQDQVLLVEGARKRLHHICFGTDEEGFRGIELRLEAAGVALGSPPKEASGDGLWFRDPDGALINVRVAEAAPTADEPEWRLNTAGHFSRLGERGAPGRDQPAKPRRLGHVMLFTRDLKPSLEFYSQVLGLQLSDTSGGFVAFLHTAGGSDHHVVALLESERPGFHHASFEVGNVDEIELATGRVLEGGYSDGWGLGRHVIGSNFFHYIRDPWNSLAEYFCDIDYIPADMQWQPRDWPPEDALYIWGPPLPDDFGRNYEEA